MFFSIRISQSFILPCVIGSSNAINPSPISIIGACPRRLMIVSRLSAAADVFIYDVVSVVIFFSRLFLTSSSPS
jgi:hypothetical protein